MAKKKTTKKVASKAVAVKDEGLVESNLNAATLSKMANYDMTSLEGIELDVTDNKDLFKNDILIPKIWLIQSMSQLRKDKVNDEGDYVDSRSEETLLEVDSDEEFIPVICLKTFKRWQTFKLVKEGTKVKKEFISSEMMVLGKNEDLPYQETVEGEDIVRRQVISCYVLLGKEAQKGVSKPYIIDFASTSKGAGRDLVSDIKSLNAKKLPSFVGWFKLGKKEESKDDNDFFVKTIKFGGLLPNEMMGFLRESYDDVCSMLDSNTIEIDDRDLHESVKDASPDTSNVSKKASKAGARI